VRSVEILSIAAVRGGSGLTRRSLQGEIRDAFFVRVPGSIEVPSDREAGEELSFGLGLEGATGPARVALTAGDEDRTLFEGVVSGSGWADHEVALPPGSGRLTLRVDAAKPGGVLLWGNPLRIRREPADPPPSVVLYVADALRADRLGFAGDQGTRTPFLDALARRALVFRRAYAAAPWTKPSMASLLSGLHPSTHGVGSRHYSDALPENAATLQDVLRGEGYATALFSANPLGGTASNLDQGFDAAFTSEAFGAAGKVQAEALHRRALEWIAARKQARFLAVVHAVDTHPPYEDGAGDEAGAYDRAIARFDGALARFHRELVRVTGGRALFVLTSDHGRSFGEHGIAGHGQSVYESEIRVPLLIEGAGLAPRFVDAPAQAVDVAPTVLDLLRVATPEPHGEGRSLLAEARREPFVVSRFVYPEGAAPLRRDEHHALIDGEWKLVLREAGSPRVELYRLAGDPQERNDLAAREPARLARMERELRARLAERARAREAYLARLGRGRAAPTALPARLLEELRALGYVR
jgi:arylsulfatase A-like enzyme